MHYGVIECKLTCCPLGWMSSYPLLMATKLQKLLQLILMRRKHVVVIVKARNNILNALSPTVQAKVICCNSSKEVWDKLKNLYEGDEKVKLQLHRAKFENLKMKESENIASYLLRVDEVANSIIGLGEEFNESIIVQKVLRSLSLRYDAKVSSIE